MQPLLIVLIAAGMFVSCAGSSVWFFAGRTHTDRMKKAARNRSLIKAQQLQTVPGFMP